MIDVYMEQFEHPYLFTLLPIMISLFALSFVAQSLGKNMIAGFLALYAMIAIIVWLLGYVAFYSLGYGRQALQWWRIRKSSGY